MCNGMMARKVEIIIEPHDIDAKPEQGSAIADSTKITSQVCNLITSVLQSSAHLPTGLTYDLVDGHARMNRQPHRQHV